MTRFVVLLPYLLTWTGQCAIGQVTDGTLLDRQPFRLEQSYDSLTDFEQWYYPRSEYEEALNQSPWIGERIHYRSDTLSVEGFIYRPAQPKEKKYPVIIYNRGGTGDFGKITTFDLVDFYLWAKEGFVIVASNYRYVNELGHLDQRGGDDVDDVMNLIPLIEQLSYTDAQNVFMLGVSRGALMTNIALRRKIPVRAAATVAGVTDARRSFERRPEFLKGWNNNVSAYSGLEKVLPDFAEKKEQYCAERSPVQWASEVDVPLLLLHSRTDSKVLVENTLQYAQALEKAGKVYSVVVYAEGGHSLPDHRQDRNQRIIQWFRLRFVSTRTGGKPRTGG